MPEIPPRPHRHGLGANQGDAHDVVNIPSQAAGLADPIGTGTYGLN